MPHILPPIISWSNAASEDELQTWVHDRLHGRDRRWIDFEGEYNLPSNLVRLVVRHEETTAFAHSSIVLAACKFAKSGVGAWASIDFEFDLETTAGGWSATALVDLLFLVSEILESAPRRSEMRNYLIRESPKLPLLVGGIPLRAKALVVLIELGGHPDKDFWMNQATESYPEAISIAFLGLARRDLDHSMSWLGGYNLETQADVIRKFRPTLVRLAGGEAPFVVLVRQYLFRSNYPVAKTLREELAPVADQILIIPKEDVGTAQSFGGRVLPAVTFSTESTLPDVNLVYYTELKSLLEAAVEIAFDQTLRAFPEINITPPSLPKMSEIVSNYLRALRPNQSLSVEFSSIAKEYLRREFQQST